MNDIRGRISSIKRQWDFFSFSDRGLMPSDYAAVAMADLEVLKGLEVQLDKTSLKNHTSASVAEFKAIRRDFGKFGKPAEHLNSIFGLSLDDKRSTVCEPWLASVLLSMRSSSRKARVAEHEWRVKEEISFRVRQGWFVVFNTLTVRPEHYSTVFSVGSLCWRDYIRNIERFVGIEIFGSVRKMEKGKVDDPFHSYFACVERGGSSGRLHIHVVHCFRRLPGRCLRDPNVGRVVPDRRQLHGFRDFWAYGFSTPIACRFSDMDAFGKVNWRWPVETVGGSIRPIMAKPAIALASYVVKYITKAYEKDDETWRVRLSRNYGLLRMRLAIRKISAKSLLSVLSLPVPWMEIRGKRVPNRRFRVEVLRSLLWRLRRPQSWNRQNGYSRLTILRLFLSVRARPPIVVRLRSMMKATVGSSSPSFGDTVTLFWSSMAVSEVLKVFHTVFVEEKERFDGRFSGCTVQR